MHWLYFYETNILEFSNLNKLQWTSLTLHSSSPFNPCFAHCCSLLLATESPYFPGPFPFWVLLLADSWFSTCFSQCGHFLRMRSRLFFYRPLYSLIVGQPSAFMASIALCTQVIPDLCVQRSCTPDLPWVSTMMAYPRGGEHLARTRSLAGWGMRLGPPAPWTYVCSLIHVFNSQWERTNSLVVDTIFQV